MMGSTSTSSPGRARRELDERERLERKLVAATIARAKEEAHLADMAALDDMQEKQLRVQARQRYDMEKRRILHQDEDERFNRLLDHGFNKQVLAEERLRNLAKDRDAAVEAKRERFAAKRQAIIAAVRAAVRPPTRLICLLVLVASSCAADAAARSTTSDELRLVLHLQKKAEQEDRDKQATKVISLGSGVGGGKGKIDLSQTRQSLKAKARTPRGGSRSPRRTGASPARDRQMTESTGSFAPDRHEALKERRLEAEKAMLLARIQKEEDRLAEIQRQKDEHREQTMRRRTMRQQAESAPVGAAEPAVDDDEPPGTADATPAPHPNRSSRSAKKGGSSAGGMRRLQSPRLQARPPPKVEEFTKTEKERLGIIKKQRCAVCTRVYEHENLPGVVSYRAVEKLREKWAKQFGSVQTKDPRYSCPTKLYDQVRVCVFCFQFFDPDEEEDA